MVRYLFLSLCVFPLMAGAQDMDFGLVEKLSSNINTNCDEVLPLLTPDGKWLYFVRSQCAENLGGRFTGTDIWISRFDSARMDWGRAANFDQINDSGNSAVIGISENGETLFMLRTTSNKRPEGIYTSSKLNYIWDRPALMEVTGLEPAEYMGAYVTPDQTVMIISMNGQDSRGGEDLYISLRSEKGQWSKPLNMGSTINSPGFEMSPFLSTDKKRLFFTSSGHPGLGNGDIFYSDRLYDSWEIWSAPKNLGEKVNSKYLDAYFSMYGDTIAYFSTNRLAQMDIFKVRTMERKNVVEGDRRDYMTDEEIQEITGIVLQSLLYFDVGVSELNDYQKQNLIRINNSLVDQKEIKFNIIALKPAERPLESYQARLLNILDFLKEGGIEGNRIIFSTEQSGGSQNKEMVRIRFFK
ncbi:MAG: hypothetical protein OEV74_12895 [Cyclobacteriaceae bacterium]|nr:hypothetical protein [Cyclobacteriaceae bacterium]MDH4297175.1 hypothetical protein [Cyclobacteriaceae bacterium]MDH5249659.1 hypothetical protein [Cyclobacteriaceae bacterium]